MRPPKPRVLVQKGCDPPQPPNKYSTDLIRRALSSSSTSVLEIAHTKEAIRSTATSRPPVVEVGGFDFPADAFKFIQIQKIRKADVAFSSSHVPSTEGEPKKKLNFHPGSSSSDSAQKTVHCGICMKFKPFSKFFSIKGCKHSYCSKCLGSYIESKVNMNVTRIKCPETQCKVGNLEPLDCKLMITKKVFDHWCDALCESVVGKKFYCPFKDCSALLTDERAQDVILESECPHCHRLFCAQCMIPWHAGLNCKEMTNLEKNKKHDMMLVKLAKNSKWQRCPLCKVYVEKLSGCMFIKCRCGCSFCYGCGSLMEIDHFCMKCKR